MVPFRHPVLILAALCWFQSPAHGAAPACAGCHPKEARLYRATMMGNSIGPPEPRVSGRIVHERSGSVITIGQRDGRMAHALAERGFTAEYAIDYQIGAGLMGRSYIVRIGDRLFESPASWFNSFGWDLSPGYAAAAVVDFDRSIDQTCLFCHSGTAGVIDSDGRRFVAPPEPITCERCHGPGEAHMRQPSSSNIVNPAKLAGPARDSVCEQCHLEGAARILNPGRQWADFRPGEPAESTFATYLMEGRGRDEAVAVSHVEQLAESQCARQSGGRLWCGTCHQPHGEPANRARRIREACAGCHQKLSVAAHPPGQSECAGCHMPRNPTTDIPHAALTDHRIPRRPGAANKRAAGEVRVYAWREPPAESRVRNLGVAQVGIGFSESLPVITERGFRLLDGLPGASKLRDPDTLSALAGSALQNSRPEEAVRFARLAAELRPHSSRAALNFGVVLKGSGGFAEAERQFARAIEIDPFNRDAYRELASLQAAQGRMRESLETLARYLAWKPQDILIRAHKQRGN